MMTARGVQLEVKGRGVATLIALLLSAACGDTFGQSRLRVHATADARLLWERGFDVERVYVPSATADGALLVLGASDCWGRDFVSEYDAATGEKLRDLPEAPGEAFRTYAPPATCPSLRERVTLSTTGEQVDICDEYGDAARELSVRDVATGAVLATFRSEELVIPSVSGDYMFLRNELAHSVDVVALDRPQVVWSWQAPGNFVVLGVSGDRAFTWDYAELYVLALADGSLVGQERLSCNWITLAGDVLACDQKLSDSSCRDTDRLYYLGPSHP